jgi:hypothetical protein
MRGLVIAAGLGAVAGAAGAVAATRLMETSDMQARLEVTQAQMSETVDEMRRLMDQARARLQAGWQTAGDGAKADAGAGKAATAEAVASN